MLINQLRKLVLMITRNSYECTHALLDVCLLSEPVEVVGVGAALAFRLMEGLGSVVYCFRRMLGDGSDRAAPALSGLQHQLTYH